MRKNFKKKVLMGLIVVIGIGIGLGFLLTKTSPISEKNALMGGIVSNIQKKAVAPEKPSEVVLDYWEALKNKNYLKAASYLTEERKKELESFFQMDITEVMRLVAEENEKAGYTKIEITKESPITANCLIMMKCDYCPGGCAEANYFNIEIVKQNGEWKFLRQDRGFGGSPSLPGKIEISPSIGTPQWIALNYFKAIFKENYSEAKRYIFNEEDFIKRYPGIAGDYLNRHGEKIGEYPSVAREYLDKNFEKLSEDTKEGIKMEILKHLNRIIDAYCEAAQIKGVVLERNYVEGKLKLCAEDVYCDEYRFAVQEENGSWKVMDVEPE